MSKILKKIAGPKIALTVKMDLLEVMGSDVADKDMFCVHWSLKSLRGAASSGDTENVRAVITDGASYAVARFNDVFAGEVHPKARKDGNGYDAMDLELRVVSPALHKKDEKLIGRATVNILDKVPVIAAGQPAHQAEQTIPLNKEGGAVCHIKIVIAMKGGAPVEEPETPEAEQPPTPTSPSAADGLVLKAPPASPQKEAGSETASNATSEVKEESESKRSTRHKKRHSSNSSAMMAAQVKRLEEELNKKNEDLKQKDEELKQKDEEFKQKDEELKKKDEELKKKDEELKQKDEEIKKKDSEAAEKQKEFEQHNAFLEGRVKELEQANEKTDVVPLDPNQERLQNELIKLQEDKERLEDDKMRLAEEISELKKENADLRAHPVVGDEKKEFDLLNQQLSALQEELAKAKKDIAAPEGAGAAPAAGGNNMMMQAIIAAVGAVLGIIIGHFI